MDWVDFLVDGVQCKMFECDGEEVVCVMFIVCYVFGLCFLCYVYVMGEELFVLEGEFCDDSGCFGLGLYICNFFGLVYVLWFDIGCVLFVKLCYFDLIDQVCVVVYMYDELWLLGFVFGLQVMLLYDFCIQYIVLVCWVLGMYFNLYCYYGGEEILVVDGIFEDEYGCYLVGSWICSLYLSQYQFFSCEGCIILVKIGYLIVYIEDVVV